MKKTVFVLLMIIIGSGFFYSTSEAKKEKAKVTIKMSTLAPRRSYIVEIMNEYRDEVRKITNNEVDFKIYPGGIQGDDLDVLRKIRQKQLHGGIFVGPGLGRIASPVRVTEIPFVFKNNEEVLYVRRKLADTMNKYFEDEGFVVLGWRSLGFVYLYSKNPLTSIEVLRKQKVWVWGDDPMMTAAYEAIGIKPIPLSPMDVLTSLSANLIDAAPITPFGAIALRWYTRFKYMSKVPAANGVGAVVVTRDIWDKISPESQKKIMAIGQDYCDKITKAAIESNRKSIGALKKEGISIVNLQDSQMDLNELGRKTRESVVGKVYSRELLDRTLAILAEYRRDHPDSTYIKVE
jgi:TRAP-type C4-dicarboxylate transport system substrate-binding protein